MSLITPYGPAADQIYDGPTPIKFLVSGAAMVIKTIKKKMRRVPFVHEEQTVIN